MTLSRRWMIRAAVCALVALALSLTGCPAVDTRDPVPDQPTMPLTASWSSADSGQTP